MRILESLILVSLRPVHMEKAPGHFEIVLDGVKLG